MGLVRWYALVAAVALASCSSAPDRAPAGRAFYYWRTTFQLSAPEREALDALHVSRLYVRMFDLEWSEVDHAPSTIARITLPAGARFPAVELVPVVFVREDLLRHVSGAKLAALAQRTWAEVAERVTALGASPIRELQLDCDWTDSTRDEYFELLRQLGSLAHADRVALSSTIRLHQIKYRERTGVPPVDRGMLMFYNMGRFSADPDARVIFDASAAERYLARVADYPLPLDVALPIWSWTLHLRDDLVHGLMESTDPDELPALDFLKPDGPDRFVATRTAMLHGTLLREGDVLKVEVTGPAEARAAAAMIAPHLAAISTRTVSLFDLSERNIHRHGQGQLDLVFGAIR